MSRIIRSFTETTGLLSRGEFAGKCDEHLRKAIEALEDLPAEKGSATITVTLKLTYESGRLDIKPEIKSKLPDERGFSSSVFWTAEGGISTQHPSQLDMLGPRDATARTAA